jgi:hypothetical protein
MSHEKSEDGSDAVAVIGLILALLLAGGLSAMGNVSGPFPLSGLILLPFLLTEPLIGVPIVALLLVLVYFGWLRPTSRGRAQFTKLTWLCVVALVALSIHWYWSGWSEGVRYQGRVYTLGCSVIGGILSGAVLAAGLVGRARNSPQVALFGRWIALVWVVTYGYPLMGEII